ncbi:MAG: SRPBCC domain-containing protein [Elusimicrobiota bacterium]
MSSPSVETADIRISAFVRAKPEQVYRCFTSARELCVWWLDRAETEARNMGRFRMVWPSKGGGKDVEAAGVFVDLEPGTKVAWIWDKPSRPRGVPALITFHIESRPRGSQVTVVHAGFSSAGPGEKLLRRYRESWEDCLAKLRLYLETGKTRKAERLKLADVDALRRKR